MKADLANLVSMTEANQNFSRVARMVDERGPVVVLRNNRPAYVVLGYDALSEPAAADDADVEEVSRLLMAKHAHAYRELAK